MNLPKDKNYKQYKIFEDEPIVLRDRMINIKPNLDLVETKIQLLNDEYKSKPKKLDKSKPIKELEINLFNKKFHMDKIVFKESDEKLNKWIIKQTDPLILFISELYPGIKINKDIEKMRPLVQTSPTISIEVYRKERKIGEEGVEYLKKLKDKYGNIILKVLWASLHFKN